jgi:hypothetical protein
MEPDDFSSAFLGIEQRLYSRASLGNPTLDITFARDFYQ